MSSTTLDSANTERDGIGRESGIAERPSGAEWCRTFGLDYLKISSFVAIYVNSATPGTRVCGEHFVFFSPAGAPCAKKKSLHCADRTISFVPSQVAGSAPPVVFSFDCCSAVGLCRSDADHRFDCSGRWFEPRAAPAGLFFR